MSDLLSVLGARAPDSLIGWRAGQAVTVRALLGRVGAWRVPNPQNPQQENYEIRIVV